MLVSGIASAGKERCVYVFKAPVVGVAGVAPGVVAVLFYGAAVGYYMVLPSVIICTVAMSHADRI